MSLPPLLSCSNRGVGSKAFELGFARKEPWGSELTSVPMGETASVNVIARIGKPSVVRFVLTLSDGIITYHLHLETVLEL